MAAHGGYQPERRVLPVPGRAAGDDLPAGRLHRECFQYLGPHRGQLRGALLRRQGGADRPDPRPCQGGGPQRRSGELRLPRRDPHGYAQHLYPGRSGRAGRRDPFGPSGHPGGRGPGRAVAFRPGVRLYHRAGAGRGRRLSRMKK